MDMEIARATGVAVATIVEDFFPDKDILHWSFLDMAIIVSSISRAPQVICVNACRRICENLSAVFEFERRAVVAGVRGNLSKISVKHPEILSKVNFSKKIKNTGNGGLSATRIRSTEQDVERYLEGLLTKKFGNKNLLSKKMTTRDGYEYYKFNRKCEYNGIKFKKGDFISRDNLHNELEWFKGVKDHKGAIDPITGKLIGMSAEKGRILRIK